MISTEQKNKIRITAIHKDNRRGVFYIAGGGLGALDKLLSVAGASNTVLEGVIPYSNQSMTQLLKHEPEKSCCEETAKKMAMAAYQRARKLGGQFGFAITSALTTTWEKKGKCRTHIAYQDKKKTRIWNYELDPKDSREDQEKIVSQYGLDCLYRVLMDYKDDESIETEIGVRLQELYKGEVSAVIPNSVKVRAILPGSFNPIHEAHIKMKKDAEARLGCKVYLELCVNNADKGWIDYINLCNRIDNIEKHFPLEDIIFTNTPLMHQKMQAIGNNIHFVIGMDTLIRIIDDKYYDSRHDRAVLFHEFRQNGGKFLVYGRHLKENQVISYLNGKIEKQFFTLKDIRIPLGFHEICTGVNEQDFKIDISSTELRNQ